MGQATTADPAPADGAQPQARAVRRLAAAALRVRQAGVPPAAQGLIALAVYLAVWAGTETYPLLRHPGTPQLAQGGFDPNFYVWALHWWPYALGHGLNPLHSAQIGAPAGYSLAWVTTVPPLALLLAPVTLTAGPVAAFSLLVVAGAPVSGWGAFVLCRRLTGRFWASLAGGAPHGYEVGYQTFSINGRMLGHGEPIRVRAGERVLLHIVNGSATEIRSLALPGHTFTVLALDGNPVPHPATVPVLWLGTAERISAIVEMTHPGVWILGDLADDDRTRGMGIVVEYAGHDGKPQWIKPPPFQWDYRRFASPDAPPPATPDETIELTFAKRNAALHGFNQWTINGQPFDMHSMQPRFRLQYGKRYRLRMHNASDDIHPMHLHRHSFEITRIVGQPVAGVIKDVAMLGGYQSMDVDFTADQRDLSLLHCHMQLTMDFGFMALFNYA